MSGFKRLKPEGGDFVTQALAVGGAKLTDSIRTMASMGVSDSKWCVPAGAQDGSARVEANIEAPSAKQICLLPAIEFIRHRPGS
ncbi:MAG: hypothetical protein ACM336_18520 [Acidobacteriota bacterium]